MLSRHQHGCLDSDLHGLLCLAHCMCGFQALNPLIDTIGHMGSPCSCQLVAGCPESRLHCSMGIGLADKGALLEFRKQFRAKSLQAQLQEGPCEPALQDMIIVCGFLVPGFVC